MKCCLYLYIVKADHELFNNPYGFILNMTHSPSLSTHELLEVICLTMGPNLNISFHVGMCIHAIFLQVLFRHTYCCSIIYVFIEKINQLNTGVF